MPLQIYLADRSHSGDGKLSVYLGMSNKTRTHANGALAFQKSTQPSWSPNDGMLTCFDVVKMSCSVHG